MAKHTAGRDALGEFAPEFAHYNDDILFGENWASRDIDLKTRCIITVITLMSSGITDSSLTYHLQNAKAHGVTRKEIVAAITHVAFYAGWPKAWAVFRLAKDVWKDEDAPEIAEPIAQPAHGEKIFGKLVRDKIPEIIEADNATPVTRVMDDDEYKYELEQKLMEECDEVLGAMGDDRAEELADVLEVVAALAKLDGKTFDDISKIAAKKHDERGGFDKKIYLEKTITK